jgi:DNA-binding NarL/FixJ family response regulator
VREEESLTTGVLLVNGREDFTRAFKGFLQRQPGLEILKVLGSDEDTQVQVTNLHPSVVLVDLEAPGLDALAVIGRLREALPDLGIVALSLSDDDAHRQAALQAGADALVHKPQLVRDMMPAIRRATGTDLPSPPVPGANLDM